MMRRTLPPQTRALRPAKGQGRMRGFHFPGVSWLRQSPYSLLSSSASSPSSAPCPRTSTRRFFVCHEVFRIYGFSRKILPCTQRITKRISCSVIVPCTSSCRHFMSWNHFHVPAGWSPFRSLQRHYFGGFYSNRRRIILLFPFKNYWQTPGWLVVARKATVFPGRDRQAQGKASKLHAVFKNNSDTAKHIHKLGISDRRHTVSHILFCNTVWPHSGVFYYSPSWPCSW
ncbi:hypothetical protein KSP39_PZI020647 [Platanthera zijinensis]|uniref:Uncharacterized protein n=1 Tax=Platanthera zijinensis TaxID=2320716 RepID=A0AAP0FXE5_9ASPA